MSPIKDDQNHLIAFMIFLLVYKSKQYFVNLIQISPILFFLVNKAFNLIKNGYNQIADFIANSRIAEW